MKCLLVVALLALSSLAAAARLTPVARWSSWRHWGIQIEVCCKPLGGAGAVFVAPTPWNCHAKPGYITSYDSSTCKAQAGGGGGDSGGGSSGADNVQCIQVLQCCLKPNGEETVTNTPCDCDAIGGTRLDKDTAVCGNAAPTPAPVSPTPASELTACIQVLACCEQGGVRRVTGTPCECTDGGGTVVSNDVQNCASSAS